MAVKSGDERMEFIEQATGELFGSEDVRELVTFDEDSQKLSRKRRAMQYERSQTLPAYLERKMGKSMASKSAKVKAVNLIGPNGVANGSMKLIGGPESSTALVKANGTTPRITSSTDLSHALGLRSEFKPNYIPPKAQWHAPWKLMRVVNGHSGWVRAICTDPENQWFATGSTDKTIKIWDLASSKLKLTLTGHIMAVRGLAASERHPYLFSVGEDKMVKCWDLEQNKVSMQYYGHLSGIYTCDVHPELDILATGGRDAVVRVWDIRSRTPAHILQGHRDSVVKVKCQAAEPQIISTSMDKSVILWDLVAGKSRTVLTHHKKAVRDVAIHPDEYTFATCSADNIKQWKCPNGDFMHNFEPPQQGIVNTLSVNSDGVLFAGADDGAMGFYDWKTGQRFQQMETIANPGSMESEKGILASTFDRTGLRLLTCETDKSIKVWREDPEATNPGQ
ncbi:pre-mRNA-splicing factor Prp46p [Trichomonascus vanleenenianus]|uniref:WD40 repeat domain-containing protein n=1 Tax=Trichomonascus vanleenenianus TaxID=2268995 RepID=UPI003ECA2082